MGSTLLGPVASVGIYINNVNPAQQTGGCSDMMSKELANYKIPFEIIEDSSKKIRIELSYYSAILLLGIYLKNTKILI